MSQGPFNPVPRIFTKVPAYIAHYYTQSEEEYARRKGRILDDGSKKSQENLLSQKSKSDKINSSGKKSVSKKSSIKSSKKSVSDISKNDEIKNDPQLFDLSKDPKELNNVAVNHPDLVDKLETLLKEAHTKATIQRFNIPVLDQ